MLFQKLKESFLLPRNAVLIIVMAVLFSGMAYCISLGDIIRYSDEQEYLSIANNLASKGLYSLDGVHPTAWRPPGYPLILSGFLFLGLKVVALRFFNYVLFAASILILFKILQDAAGKTAGLIAAILILLYPVTFYTASTLLPTTLGSFLLLLFIFFVVHNDTYSTKYAILSGLAIGFLMLSIPTFIFVLIVVLFFIIIRRHDFKTATVIVLSSSLVIAPWVARNYLVFNSFVPFSTNSGINLLLGNSPNTTANAGTNVDISKYTLPASTLTETERDAYYRSEAIKYIAENKIRSLTLYYQKMLNYFNYRNKLATTTQSSNFKDLLMFITYYPLLLLITIRIFYYKKYPFSHIEQYFIAIYIFNAFFQAIFFTRIRFRLPFDFLLIGVVAIFLSRFIRMKREGILIDRKPTYE